MVLNTLSLPCTEVVFELEPLVCIIESSLQKYSNLSNVEFFSFKHAKTRITFETTSSQNS
jgi:hypothetical protein